jgi:hypothetical protein
MTTHQLVGRRENLSDDLDDWCKDNVRVSRGRSSICKISDHQQEILDRCVKEGEGYGGYWGDGKRAVHLSNVVRE